MRVDSDCLAEGDRERRSNRERRGSGSVWSKRERFARRSSSAIATTVGKGVGSKVNDRMSDEGRSRSASGGNLSGDRISGIRSEPRESQYDQWRENNIATQIWATVMPSRKQLPLSANFKLIFAIIENAGITC